VKSEKRNQHQRWRRSVAAAAYGSGSGGIKPNKPLIKQHQWRMACCGAAMWRRGISNISGEMDRKWRNQSVKHVSQLAISIVVINAAEGE